MRIAVIQHRLLGTAQEDAATLAHAAARAAREGAKLVVLPDVFSIHADGADAREGFSELLAPVPACCLVPHVGPGSAGAAFVVELPSGAGLPSGVGKVALLDGDSCMDAGELASAAAEHPSIAVLLPRCENDLQAEAVLELAIALSDSLAGLVVVADSVGAEPGEPGHGGSAIILLGKVLAEAVGDDELLIADITLPVPQPEPREPLPAIPPLLLQRLAFHQGRKLEVTEYHADTT